MKRLPFLGYIIGTFVGSALFIALLDPSMGFTGLLLSLLIFFSLQTYLVKKRSEDAGWSRYYWLGFALLLFLYCIVASTNIISGIPNEADFKTIKTILIGIKSLMIILLIFAPTKNTTPL